MTWMSANECNTSHSKAIYLNRPHHMWTAKKKYSEDEEAKQKKNGYDKILALMFWVLCSVCVQIYIVILWCTVYSVQCPLPIVTTNE